MNALLDLLDARRSTPSRLLSGPGPDDAALLRMLQSARRVPDHGGLSPWRVLLIRGEARARLGEVLARRSRERDPDAPESVVEKDRARFHHAPVVLAVIACIRADHRIPEQEQLLSAGCVCFSLLLAAQAMGFGAQWLTGWAAYDGVVAERLGLAEGERIVGFLHIGQARQAVPERPRPDPAALLSDWQGDIA